MILNRYADAAINCKAKLSDAEEILKDALVSVKQGHYKCYRSGEKACGNVSE